MPRTRCCVKRSAALKAFPGRRISSPAAWMEKPGLGARRVVNRIKAGEDPVPEPLPARLAGGPTVAGLAARYMEKHVAVRCKQSTAEGIRGLLGKYILPEFGKLPLLAVERERVAAFHVRLNGVPYAANRAAALMSRMYAMAADWEMVPDGTNPCRSVRKYPARGRERFLTDTEFRRAHRGLL